MINFRNVVGRRIRQFRQEHDGGKGISQSGLARAVGFKTSMIFSWEGSFSRPKVEELEALAVFLGRSFLDFYRDDRSQKRDISLKALVEAVSVLGQEELDDVRRYAESKQRNGRPLAKREMDFRRRS